MLFATFLYLYIIYNSGFKNIIWRIPFLKASPFLALAVGLAPCLFFLIILWSNSFILFRTASDTTINRRTYLLDQIKLNAPILLPVFLFSLFIDILNLLSIKGFDTTDILSSSGPFWFFPFLILLIIVYPMVMRFVWGCYPMPNEPRRKKIEQYCKNAGLKISNIFLWPAFHGRSLTAGITGVIGKLRYLFITPGLLNALNDEELESVIAHEAGHVKMGHIYYYCLLFFGLPVFMFLLSDLLSLGIYGFADLMTQSFFIRNYDTNFFSLSVLTLLAVFIFLYLRIFFGLLSRNFERQADLFVFEVVGHPLNLISSLEKISHYVGNIKDSPNWHHYSLGERIKFLQDCLIHKQQIELHQRKVRTIKKVFFSIFVLALLSLGLLHHPHIRNALTLHLMEGQIRRVMAENPESIELKIALADIFLERHRYDKAKPLYQHVIQLNPHNVTALNNLAWLYATSEDERYRDSEKALTLARKAADLKQEPYILDTLAEAYFINGMGEEALKTIEAAIKLRPDNVEYYLRQKQKFIGKEIRE